VEDILMQERLSHLRRILVESLSEGELRDLCFDLDVEYADLPGEGRADKARELVRHLDRRDRISQLVEVGKRLRPDVLWEAPSVLPQSQIPHNLPPRSEFVGRKAEKARVHEALCSRSYLISIDGIGGIGKSSLALEVAFECLEASREETPAGEIATFDGFIWTTAKDRDLNLDDLLDAVALTLEYPGIAQHPVEQKVVAVRKLLQDKPCLLIVDNFETITDDGIRDFLLNLPEPSKALITTREQKLRQVWAVSLKGLTESEALALIRTTGRQLGLAALERGDDQTLRHLVEATGGVPLAIKWAIGQIKQRGQSLDTVLLALREAEGNIFDYTFARSWDLLSETARQVLMVMLLFATSASRAGIEAASDVHHFALDEALGQLVEMSLVDASDELDLTRQRYSIHPLTRAFAGTKLQQESGNQDAARKRLADFFKSLTEDYGGFWNREGYAQLDLELPNILAVVQWCWEQQIPELAKLGMDILYNANDFLNIRGYWNDAMTLGQQAIVIATSLEDELRTAKFRLWPVGWVYRHRDDLDSAEDQVKQALTVFERHSDREYIAYTKRNLARIFQRRGELEQAEPLLKEVLDLYQSNEDERQVYFVTANLAEVALEKGDLDTAWTLCNNVLTPARRFDDPERVASILDVLGGVARRRGHLEQAKAFWEEALILMRRVNRPDATADNLFRLAQVEIETGQTQTAKQRLLDALDIYQRLDIHSKVREIEELLDGLPKFRNYEQDRGHQSSEN
jgi:tetratricopeptide (TPR) repeat protein